MGWLSCISKPWGSKWALWFLWWSKSWSALKGQRALSCNVCSASPGTPGFRRRPAPAPIRDALTAWTSLPLKEMLGNQTFCLEPRTQGGTFGTQSGEDLCECLAYPPLAPFERRCVCGCGETRVWNLLVLRWAGSCVVGGKAHSEAERERLQLGSRLQHAPVSSCPEKASPVKIRGEGGLFHLDSVRFLSSLSLTKA